MGEKVKKKGKKERKKRSKAKGDEKERRNVYRAFSRRGALGARASPPS